MSANKVGLLYYRCLRKVRVVWDSSQRNKDMSMRLLYRAKDACLTAGNMRNRRVLLGAAANSWRLS